VTSPSLFERLGDALEDAVRADVAAAAPVARRAQRRRPARGAGRRLVIAVVALAVAVPGIAIGAEALIGPDDVALGLPGGTLALAGTNPTCTVVEEGVEYHCVLEHPPEMEFDSWLNVAEAAVSADDHRVIGGCRGLTDDGIEWQCYLGQAAVDHEIVSAEYLGQESGPSVG
jgi:hypothetical protein